MKKTHKNIVTAYSILHTEIETANDLKKYNLTLSDYNAARQTMEELRTETAKTTTIYRNVAEFFKMCGYSVTPAGIGYKIENHPIIQININTRSGIKIINSISKPVEIRTCT